MKRLALIAALSASPAFAEIDVFVVQDDGSGVVQFTSQRTDAELAVLIEEERPANATGVILRKNGVSEWTTETPEEVNKRYGGEGESYIEHRESEDDQDEAEMEFDADEEERRRRAQDDDSDVDFEGTQELTPLPDSMAARKIQPRDGFWIIEIMDQTFIGCPAAIESAARQQVAALNTSGNTGIFGPNFTPEQMAPDLDWTKIGANSWYGFREFASGPAVVAMQWGVQVVSPTIIDHRQHMTFGTAALGNCEVYTFVKAAWMH